MKARSMSLILLIVAMATALSGCGLITGMTCYPNCRSEARASSSLVSFLYPHGEAPPPENSIPELRLPIRVGLAFLPSPYGVEAAGLEASRREEILERIRKRFADRKFIGEIVIVPDYYLRSASGFEGLAGVQRLYNIDIMALVSYDQVTYRDDNKWSMGYLTIVGAYVLKGSRHDVTTLMDLAVVDPVTQSILLRAGGTDTRHGTTTMVDEQRESRESQTESYSKAANQLIDNFDAALAAFEADVREGKAKVRVTRRPADGHSAGFGGGSCDLIWIVLFGALLLGRRRMSVMQT